MAREVASTITKDSFESELEILFDGLPRCSDAAFQR